VIAQACIADRAVEGAEDLAAAIGGVAGDAMFVARAFADEVAGEQDHVGGELVDVGDGVLEEELLGELDQVNVAELDDAIAVECLGEAADPDLFMDDLELVPGDLERVEGCAHGGDADAGEEAAAGETWAAWVVDRGVVAFGA